MKYFRSAIGLFVLAFAFSSDIRGAHADADHLAIDNQGCLPGLWVHFRWQPGAQLPAQQWIDISSEDNGWLEGTFQSSPALDGSHNIYSWRGLTPATAYYVRLNQLRPHGSWNTTPTLAFTTRECPSHALRVIGFSTKPDTSVAELTPPDGAIQGCERGMLYVFVNTKDAPPQRSWFYSWSFNTLSLTARSTWYTTRDPEVMRTELALDQFPADRGSYSGLYTLRLSVGIPPERSEASIRLAC
jgi:hypothetical protein